MSCDADEAQDFEAETEATWDTENHPAGAPDVPTGWYVNPDGLSSLRWWDGTRWSNAIAEQRPSAPPTADEIQRRKKRSRPGWIGLWLGFASTVTLGFFGLFLGGAAVVLGRLGLKRANDDYDTSGRRVAIAALVLGVLNVVVGLVWMVPLSTP
jgi:hypothetical protein